MIFDPMDFDETVSPAAIVERTQNGEHARALVISVQLNEESYMAAALDAVPYDNLQLVARSLPSPCVPRLLQLLAKRLPQSAHLEYHLQWALYLLQSHGLMMKKDGARHMSTCRSLQKSILRAQEDLGRLCDENQYTLSFVAAASEQHKLTAKENLGITDTEVES